MDNAADTRKPANNQGDRPTTTVGGVAGERLKSYIERIERLNEEIKSLNEDKSEVLKEAKSSGFDAGAMKIVIKRRAMDKDDLDEQDHLVELYSRALGMLPDLRDAAE